MSTYGMNYTISFRAMGSHIQVWLNVLDRGDAEVLRQVPATFEAWEATLSRFRPDSELNYLNANAGEWVTVSAVLFENIIAATEAAAMTNGLVNPLILPALEAAGYSHSFQPEIFEPIAVIEKGFTPTSLVENWQAIEFDFSKRRIKLPSRSRIDLGGTAKGWAAQQTAEWLGHYGPCLIDAGGDMVAREAPDESGGWLVTVPVLDQQVLLTNEAIATSGTDYRRWINQGKPAHHLIDPRTGESAATRILNATIIAPDALRAEAWAKATLISEAFSSLPTFVIYNDSSTHSNSAFEWRINHVH